MLLLNKQGLRDSRAIFCAPFSHDFKRVFEISSQGLFTTNRSFYEERSEKKVFASPPDDQYLRRWWRKYGTLLRVCCGGIKYDFYAPPVLSSEGGKNVYEKLFHQHWHKNDLATEWRFFVE